MGSTTSSLLRASLSHEQLVSWGWRIPFLAGVLVSACGFYLKGHGSDHTGQGYQQTSVSGREENADDDELLLHPTTLKNPLIEAFSRHNLRPLLAACMAPMLWASGFYLWFVWMAIYMAKLISNPVPGAFPLNAAALFFSVCLLFPIAGALSDKFGRLRIMSLGAVGMGILSPLLIRLIAIGNPVFAFLSQCTMGVFLSLYGAPMCAWLVEAFEPQARLTSVAIGYNVAQAIAGGSTPFLATYFVDNIGVRSPGWILTFLALTGLTGLHCVAPALLGPSNFGAVPFVNVDSSRGD